MGMNVLGRKCWTNPTSPLASAPNPGRFVIVDHIKINGTLVVRIKYHDCTNFEGEKVLVFPDMTITALRARTEIDPHFAADGFSPFARFKPTTEGWNAACAMAQILRTLL
jgi:hypothetical protein